MSGSRAGFDAGGDRRSSACARTRSSTYLALMGDSVDNIPGVDKCGPKTAAKWLAEYGTLDGVIAQRRRRSSGKIGENLRAALPRLPLNRAAGHDQDRRRRSTARPQTLALRDARRRRAARAVRALRLQRGAARARRRRGAAGAVARAGAGRARGSGFAPRSAPAAAPIDPALAAPGEYETHPDAARSSTPGSRGCRRADDSPSTPRPIRSIRCRRDLVGLSFAVEPGKAAYLPLGARLSRRAGAARPRRRRWPRCGRCSRTRRRRKVGQHGKYDLHVLRRARRRRCAATPTTRCWRASCSTAGASRHDMDSLAARYLGYDTIKYERRRRQGRQADPVLAGRARRRHPLRRRGRRRHPAPAPRAVRRSSPPSRACSASTARSRCRWCRCSSAWRRNGVLIDADELRRQTRRPGASACSPRSSRRTELAGRSLQPRFAQAAAASCCSTN